MAPPPGQKVTAQVKKKTDLSLEKKMLHTYNLKVISRGSQHLEEFLHQGSLVREHRRPLSGCAATETYQIHPRHLLRIVDDFGVEINDQLLQVNLFRLPSWAYGALLEQVGKVPCIC